MLQATPINGLPQSGGVAERFDQLLRRSDSVAFDSRIGEIALIESTGRINAINEAWSRLAAGQWSDTGLAIGDNFLHALRDAAYMGDDYAQSAVLGVVSVLSGSIPSFSLRYAASTSRGWRWFELTATPAGRSTDEGAVIVIHESHDQEPSLSNWESTHESASPELAQIAAAVADMTDADCAMISVALADGGERCEVVAQSADFPTDVLSDHERSGSPCGETHEDGFIFCQSGVQRRFPEATWLQELGANGFADLAVRTPDGEFLGHISVLHYTQLTDPLSVEASLRLFAARALGEMEQILRDRRRQTVHHRASSAEARYAALFQSLSDGIVVLDKEWNVIDANQRAGELLEMPAHSLVGQSMSDYIVFNSLQGTNVGDGWRGSVTLAKPDGTPVEVKLSIASMKTGDEDNFFVVARPASETQTGAPSPDEVPAWLSNERNKSEAIRQAAAGLVIFVDREGVFLEEEPGTELPPVEPSARPSVKDMLQPKELQTCLVAIAQAIDFGRLVVIELPGEVEGQEGVFEWRIFPYGDGSAVISILKRAQTADVPLPADRPSEAATAASFRRNPYGLTFRELTILNALSSGTTDKEIAEHLCLSIYTVNKHVANILGKMQATSRTEAAVRAAKEGLLA